MHRYALAMDEPLPGTHGEACEAALIASLLDEHERRRAARFRRPGDARRWSRVRVRLRQLLGRRCGLAPEAVRFTLGPHGKPALSPPMTPPMTPPASASDERADPVVALPAWRFNLSHARRHAVIVLGRGAELGVDIERIDPARDTAALVGTVLDEQERRAFAALPDEACSEAFTRVWVRKEAVLKALGAGIGFGLQRVHVGIGAVPVLRIDARPAPAWRLDDLPAPAGHRAALCRGEGAGRGAGEGAGDSIPC